ncbi:MAG: Kelch repeat-containing protein [Acidimicrobiales bacterium]
MLLLAGLVTLTERPASAAFLGQWYSAPPLTEARFHATSVLMGDGRVLVSGGRVGDALRTTAEVLSPFTMHWTPTGSMGTPRWQHTATALPNGKVLVTGGFTNPFTLGANAQPVSDTAELYDPATATWTATGPMTTRRALHVAQLLDNGKVLVAGGRTCDQPPPTACNFTFRTNTAELYDPATGAFTPTGSMQFDRHTTAAVKLLDGRVLVPAGFTNVGNGPNGDIYDPATGTWSQTLNLVESRARQGGALLPGGRVLVMAGFPNRTTSETYDPGTNQWTLSGNVVAAGRFNFSFTTLPDGRVLMAGGQVPGTGISKTAELWASGAWTPLPDMANPHGNSSSLGNSEKAIVLSGNPDTYVTDSSKCGNRCGAVLVIGNHAAGAVDLFVPSCTASSPTTRAACLGPVPVTP